jgi:c(7)-type cytochrome triheme protein
MGDTGLLFKIKSFVEKHPLTALFSLFILILLIIYLNIEVIHFTSQPQFCAKCHPKEAPGILGEVFTWKDNIHAKYNVACLDCHAKPGIINYFITKSKGLKDTFNFAFRGQEHMIKVLHKSFTDPVYASKVVSSESCLFCHTDYYNEKFRKERLIKLPLVHFRTLEEVKNPEWRKAKGMIDILTEEVRRTPDIDPKHASHIKAGVSCVFCHRRVAHGGQLINLASANICEQERVCSSCHIKNKDVINMKDIIIQKAGNPARFSHNTHVQTFECDTCHFSLFKMKSGTTLITFKDHNSDKYCFSCHGENKAAPFSCELCHSL